MAPLTLAEAIRMICTTCGCSLVRLGIPRERWIWTERDGRRYAFRCDGCRRRFEGDPERVRGRTEDLVVCPTCLGETPFARAEIHEHAGEPVYFCGCPACPEWFYARPEEFLERLTGRTAYPGVFGAVSACCP